MYRDEGSGDINHSIDSTVESLIYCTVISKTKGRGKGREKKCTGLDKIVKHRKEKIKRKHKIG